MAKRENTKMGGWVLFASVMMMLIGAANVFGGLIAVLDGEEILKNAGSVPLVDVSTWGWAHMILGALLVIAGLGLLAMQPWARIAGILFAGINVVEQMTYMSVHPAWSVTLIGLDSVVIYALAVYNDPYAP